MKTIVIAGRLTKDAEMKRSQDGDAILQFTVAVDDYNGKDKGALFFDTALFGKRATSLEQYLLKGTSVAVSGEFSVYNAENGKTYLKVRANDVTLMGGAPKRDDAPQQQRAAPQRRNDYVPATTYDDEIPFEHSWK
jgi:single-strand DNA-binding protein